jgi:hypothetical protein
MLRLRLISDAQPRTKNGPTGPEHHRRGQEELQPVHRLPPEQVQPGEMRTHLQHQDREGQHEADLEPPLHVGELGIRPGVRRGAQGLERHAADRAAAGADLADFGVHRAGVDRLRSHRLGRRRLAREVAVRVGRELRPAAGAAEIPSPPAMLVPVRRPVRVDPHPADRIGGDMRTRPWLVRRVVPVLERHRASPVLGRKAGTPRRVPAR